jgi:hypothetical protein
MTDKPQSVILNMSSAAYFTMLAKLLGSTAPPAAADAPMLERIAKIGVVPGKPFDIGKLATATRLALATLPRRALQRIEAGRNASMGAVVGGWVMTSGLGVYGTDYLKRAVVAAYGWPANLEKDAIYPYTAVDSEGRTLSGASKYTLKFAKGQTPPVNGFWSITMYEIDKGWWFVPNPLDKFTVSERNGLKPNGDGSITLYFQHDLPGKELEANWLPAPKGDFILMLRMYWPKETNPSVLDGSWKPPPVHRVG